MPQTVDSLIHARWVIPVEPAGACLERHSVAVENGVIIDILPTADTAKKYQSRETVNLHHHALIPGLVNAHTHAAMTLFRGMADDLVLAEWLQGHIWPAETAWVSPDFVRDGTLLSIAEMLRSGTTCFNDMYFFPDVVARVAAETGIRACVGLILIDFPTAWAQTAQEYIEKGLALHDELRHSELVRTAFAPHAPYTVSDAPLEKVRVLSDELDLPVHMHVHETAHEIEESLARYGMRPLERLERLGLLNPHLLAVHMTQLYPEEMATLAARGVHVLHCPESNLKLGNGFCEVARLLAAGVNVALGTDGAASNNDLDMLVEMRTAALLAKGVSRDPTAVPAHTALRMATLNGARALGLDDVIGSLVPGKAADMTALDLSHLSCQPVYDAASQVVYAASRDQVTDVWVAGRQLLKNGELTTLDRHAILRCTVEWGRKIQEARSGKTKP
ncbi:MAG: N-ethylammeline chlorohydrolase [Candidatus Muproteobacteria bacterium RBG_16_64_11]|uniref:5-methylthioadenosine/S-adenosylhomocysteine deaminase n=1 Tax=Candidatus Muproteobacteria bacterium RBG_16_64_11 TaxID=1817758 RepID=A0A1F6TAX2_9PROT|nr:MAG: N-ethylammeline chlorohydrolase [Candidatus Muproteobacteria bacterium RBG_16_64_11]